MTSSAPATSQPPATPPPPRLLPSAQHQASPRAFPRVRRVLLPDLALATALDLELVHLVSRAMSRRLKMRLLHLIPELLLWLLLWDWWRWCGCESANNQWLDEKLGMTEIGWIEFWWDEHDYFVCLWYHGIALLFVVIHVCNVFRMP